MFKLIHRIKYFLSIRLRYNYEKISWRILKLNIKTPAGLTIDIKSTPDWQIYNEIFVKGDYDFAFEKSIQNINTHNHTLQFLDLGSNVGFFTLRYAEFLFQQKNTHFDFEGLLVEGSLPVFKELQSRLNSQPLIKNKLQIVHGLVGKTTGTAKMFESANSVTNSISTDSALRKKFQGRTVSYIDLNNFYETTSEIDLLKCDIEGSELDFAENYEGLLKRVKVAVFELHHTKCNTEKCVQIIMNSGMINRKIIFNYGNHTSLEVFWR